VTIKSILVPVHGAPDSPGVLDAALELGRRFHAYVELLHVEADLVKGLAGLGVGIAGATARPAVEEAEAAGEARSDAARRFAAERCRAAGLGLVEAGPGSSAGHAVAWRQLVGRANEEVGSRGRLFDLIVVGRPGAEGAGLASGVFEAAVFDTRRPALLVPAAATEAPGQRAVIAWNGSAEAAAAVGGALPFLRQAEEVTVVAIGDGEGAVSPEGLVGYLACHGVRAAVRHVAPGRAGFGVQILETAEALGADLVIMGAYGHSRFRELVLGGATRDILGSATLPVLMAH
jgi:nucleotide-binding universal stress UspA family protein